MGPARLHATITGPSPEPLPAVLVDSSYEASNFSKLGYFKRVQASTGWTASRYEVSTLRVLPPPNATAERPRLCVTGDSISREIGEELQTLLGSDEVRNLDLLLSYGSNIGVGQMALAHVSDVCSRWCYRMRRDRKVYSDSQRALCSRRVPATSCGDCSVLIVGGLSLHWLLSNTSSASSTATYHDMPITHRDPVQQHATYFATMTEGLSALATSAGVSVVMVGSAEVDELTVLADPAKPDWAAFAHFSMLRIWRHMEREHLARAAASLSPRLFFFDAGAPSLRYRGVRCDGIHFGKDFALKPQRGRGDTALAWSRVSQPHHTHADCYASPAVWHLPLLMLLERVGWVVHCARSSTTWARERTACQNS